MDLKRPRAGKGTRPFLAVIASALVLVAASFAMPAPKHADAASRHGCIAAPSEY
jgi:hypothetical protein